MRVSPRMLFGGASFAFLTACSSAGTSSYSVLDQPNSGWNLVFQDEFNGVGRPDADKWISQEYERKPNSDGPDGWWLKENVRLTGWGHLEIRTTIIPNQNDEDDDDPHDYATGMLSTEGKFERTFGRYEARMKLPQDPGWWMAFWLFTDGVHSVDGSGEDGTEIDIVEAFGWTDEINHALHWDSYEEDHKTVHKRYARPGVREGWHVFALEWTEEEYVWFVDGEEVWRTSAGGVSKVPSYVKLSGEVSSHKSVANKWWSNKPDDRRFPDRFLVDWVRVYEKDAP